MADKNLLQLPLATDAAGAVIYGVQDGQDKAFPSGVLVGTQQPQAANTVLAGPVTAPGGIPTYRPLVAADIPDLSGIYLPSSGGTLTSTTINNATIVGGSISGATAVFDDTKFTLRDNLDTTKTTRFELNPLAAGVATVLTVPTISTTLVGTNTADNLTNKRVYNVASTTTQSSFRIVPGTAPTAPANGDIWTTNAGMFLHVNNTTTGPFAAAAGSTVNTFNGRSGTVVLNTTDVTTALGFTPYNPASGSYVLKTGDNMSGDLRVNKTSATYWVGSVGVDTGGVTSYNNTGTVGDVGLFSDITNGTVRLRPDGRLSNTGQLLVNTSGFTWNGNTGWHAGNFVPGNYTPTTWTLTAGAGLTGGGTSAANRTISMGTPSAITGTTTSSATGTTHTHALNTTFTAANGSVPVLDYPQDTTVFGQITSGGPGGAANTVHLTGSTSSGNRSFQISFPAYGGTNTPEMWFRTSHASVGGGGWTAWSKVLTSGDIDFSSKVTKAGDTNLGKMTFNSTNAATGWATFYSGSTANNTTTTVLTGHSDRTDRYAGLGVVRGASAEIIGWSFNASNTGGVYERMVIPGAGNVTIDGQKVWTAGDFAINDYVRTAGTSTIPAGTTSWTLAAGSASGSDTTSIRIQSGGAFNQSRGAILELNGLNEATNPGAFRLLGGNGTTSIINGGTGSTVLLQSSTYNVTGALQINGNAVWHAGNFNSANIPAQIGDLHVGKASAVITVGANTSNISGGLANYASSGSYDVGVYADGTGNVRLRPSGRLSSTGELLVNASTASWNGNALWHAGNFTPSNYSLTTHTHAAADVVSGTFADARIPALAISKITNLQTSLDAKAPTASPSFTGNATVAGTTTTAGSFISSTTSAILATTGAGSVFLRPNGSVSATGQLVVASTGNVTVNGNLNATGSITATGGFGPPSDPKLKDESSLKTIDNALDKVYNINVRRGKYIESFKPGAEEQLFLMADGDMKAAAPEVLRENSVEHEGQSYNSWSADQMIALLTKAVQELTEQVNTLKEKLGD